MAVLSEEEGEIAVRLARRTLDVQVGGRAAPGMEGLPAVFDEDRGVFVTLKQKGELRGCIGFPYPIMPLRDALTEAAVAAATEDPRFPPVTAGELGTIVLEVTVMTRPKRLECAPAERASRIEVGRHGIIVRGRGSGGLLLPQVATEYGWDARTFLDHTCIKACLAPGCWMRDDIEIETFEGQIFHEQR